MARGRRSRVLKPSGLRPFILDDATGASAPTSDPNERVAISEASARARDERVRLWLGERARFERSQQAEAEGPAQVPAPEKRKGPPAAEESGHRPSDRAPDPAAQNG